MAFGAWSCSVGIRTDGIRPEYVPSIWNSRPQRRLGYDARPMVDQSDISSGFTRVPVHINDNGLMIRAAMLASLVGIVCTSSRRLSAEQNRSLGLDSLSNISGSSCVWTQVERSSY